MTNATIVTDFYRQSRLSAVDRLVKNAVMHLRCLQAKNTSQMH